jgi:hypothetical protein
MEATKRAKDSPIAAMNSISIIVNPLTAEIYAKQTNENRTMLEYNVLCVLPLDKATLLGMTLQIRIE